MVFCFQYFFACYNGVSRRSQLQRLVSYCISLYKVGTQVTFQNVYIGYDRVVLFQIMFRLSPTSLCAQFWLPVVPYCDVLVSELVLLFSSCFLMVSKFKFHYGAYSVLHTAVVPFALNFGMAIQYESLVLNLLHLLASCKSSIFIMSCTYFSL